MSRSRRNRDEIYRPPPRWPKLLGLASSGPLVGLGAIALNEGSNQGMMWLMILGAILTLAAIPLALIFMTRLLDSSK
ncbi:MAG: hypothetical protein ACFCU3_04220 [Verrucomicrobiales bacterium]